MIHLLPRDVNRIEGVIRFKMELEAIMVLTSSSGLNSEYGSYPSGIISPIVFLRAVKFLNLLYLYNKQTIFSFINPVTRFIKPLVSDFSYSTRFFSVKFL